ncbi:MAG: cell division protein FtsZ [Alphaproteobacteria bacterium]|nr:cell division protein FtsZ [Alphaproteobacteria bacterium]
MSELNLFLPESSLLKPRIIVFGVGGAGGNAVNNMITSNLDGIDFVVTNTDAQAIENSMAQNKIQLGPNITKGLGAGSSPEIGRGAAEEVSEEICAYLQECNMVFITAGMGGGTGTGAAPVIARLAREQGALTVAVVTKPFHFEGSHRMKIAELGLEELHKYVDTLIVIPNQNLFRIANEKTTFADAFRMADSVLHSGVRSITDLMLMPGLINLDFADVRAVMGEMGNAMMGTGEAEGENRAIKAAEAAISNPLLDNTSMQGARGVLINITGGGDMTLFEVDEAANRIRQEVDPEANIIFGSAFNEQLDGKIRVSVVATGIDTRVGQPGGLPLHKPSFAKVEHHQTHHQTQPQPAPEKSDQRIDPSVFNAEKAGFTPQKEQQSYIPPRPAEAAPPTATPQIRRPQTNVFNSAIKPEAVDHHETTETDQEDQEDQETPRGLSLFSRSPKHRPEDDKHGQRQLETVGAAPEERKIPDDVFDIPAFLRRNKN